MAILKRLFSPGVLLGLLALVVATSGAAMALPGHNSVRSDDIVNGQVRSIDIANGTIVSRDVHRGTFQRAVKHHALTIYEDQTTLVSNEVNGGVGGTFAWTGDLHDNPGMTGTSLGTSYGTCTETDAAGNTGECTYSVDLAGGQITATGVIFPVTPGCGECSGTIAVVGGTGAYAGASGVVTETCNLSVTPKECTFAYKFDTP